MAALVWTTTTGANVSRESTGAVGDTFNSGATDGMQLSGVGAFAVHVEADASQTLTAAGGLTAYVLNPHTSRWSRAEQYDCAAGTVTGVRSVLAGAFNVLSPVGRIGYQNNGFTVSSGSLTIRLVASQPNVDPYGGKLL